MDLGWPLDDTVEIDGQKYKLNLAFDNVLRLIDLMNDRRLNHITQIETGLKMLIGTDLPEYSITDKEKILYQIFQMSIGDDVEKNVPVDLEGNPMPQADEEPKRYFSLKQDAEYIFAAFVKEYGIDLFEMQGKLHWKKFKALLTALLPNCSFREIVEIRASELPSGKGMGKRREQLRKLKQIYALKEDEP